MRYHLTGKKGISFMVMLVLITASFGLIAESEDELDIREIASVRRGEFVAVRGEVVRFREEDEFRIRDESGRIDIYIGQGNFSRPPFSLGDTVTVLGWVDDDILDFPKDIYATELILADGTVLAVRYNRDWD